MPRKLSPKTALEQRKAPPAAATQQGARWRCPSCRRLFTRKSQPHVCTSRAADAAEAEQSVLRGRPQSVVQTYEALLKRVRDLGPVEVFARERYVLLRSVRIFADLVIMADAVRVAIHVSRALEDPIFFKVVSDRKQVTHVAKLQSPEQVQRVEAYLREAYAFSLRDGHAADPRRS